MKLAKRVSDIAESVTLNITSKAKKMVKEGIDVVNLAAGDPDFDTPNPIKTANATPSDEICPSARSTNTIPRPTT